MKLISPDPAARCQSAAEFIELIEPILLIHEIKV